MNYNQRYLGRPRALISISINQKQINTYTREIIAVDL
jgi:hypothetical protein